MLRWTRRLYAACWGAAFVAVVACGGKSGDERNGSPAFGGSAGAGGAREPQPGCTFNGVHYVPGETFGPCQECKCDGDTGVHCVQPACASGVGGTMSSAGGLSGVHAGSAGRNGGSSGVGGAAPLGGASGSSGSSGSGLSGSAGSTASCTNVKVDSFCVVGTPAGDGQDFAEGMPLIVVRRPSGCHSSSCTLADESSCNAIGSDGKYWVSSSVCLSTQGDVCTDDCGGGSSPCDLGPMKAGEYTIGLGGTAAPSVKFKVPSHVKNADLCASTGTP